MFSCAKPYCTVNVVIYGIFLLKNIALWVLNGFYQAVFNVKTLLSHFYC